MAIPWHCRFVGNCKNQSHTFRELTPWLGLWLQPQTYVRKKKGAQAWPLGDLAELLSKGQDTGQFCQPLPPKGLNDSL